MILDGNEIPKDRQSKASVPYDARFACMNNQQTTSPSIKKAGVMQSHLLHKMCFSQYQALSVEMGTAISALAC